MVLQLKTVTYFGIQITKDNPSCTANFNPFVTKTMKRFNCWLQRDLPLKGRGLLVKAEGLSNLTYAAQSLYVDKPTCKVINGIFIQFLWKNKSHYLKESVILNTHKKGGLYLIDFSSLNNWLK